MYVLILAGIDSPELGSITADLADLLPESPVVQVSDVRTASERITHRNLHPELLIVAQSAPDEFTRQDVVELFRLAPLARWICCYSSWCESDGRNRDIWPPGSRVPFHGFRARLMREIQVLNGMRPPLPLTASRDEVFEFDAVGIPKSGTRRRVEVDSPDPELKTWLFDLIKSAGHLPVQGTAATLAGIPDVVFRDLDPCSGQVSSEPRRVVHADGPRPVVIGLMGLPHPEDAKCATSAGCDKLLSKLAPLEELLAAIV